MEAITNFWPKTLLSLENDWRMNSPTRKAGIRSIFIYLYTFVRRYKILSKSPDVSVLRIVWGQVSQWIHNFNIPSSKLTLVILIYILTKISHLTITIVYLIRYGNKVHYFNTTFIYQIKICFSRNLKNLFCKVISNYLYTI